MEQVVAELEKLNKKADVIIGIMQTPENKFLKSLEIVGNAISILAIVDLIRNWLLGSCGYFVAIRLNAIR